MLFASISTLGLVALLPYASAAVHDVQVGQNGLTFTPEAIFANAGDTVTFHFNPKNHSVTQSSFASPCGAKDGGLNSGFMPVAAGTTNLPTFSFIVNDTQPVWIHCAQAAGTPNSHCGAGMVFAVNCGQDGQPNSFTNFKAAAEATLNGGTGGNTGGATTTYTAAYGGVTVPPPEVGVPATKTIILAGSTWTTTYTSYPNSPDPTPAALAGAVHTIVVGGPGKLAFDPPHISAQPRDVVVFQFQQKNHTATQSSFADPCRKLSANGATGFDSGFMPVADSVTDGYPTWNLTINDTAPIWGYCRQQAPSSHCGAGMVFSINSDESGQRNFAAFQQLAKTINGTSAAVTTGGGNGYGSGAPAGVRVTGGALALVFGAVFALML